MSFTSVTLALFFFSQQPRLRQEDEHAGAGGRLRESVEELPDPVPGCGQAQHHEPGSPARLHS